MTGADRKLVSSVEEETGSQGQTWLRCKSIFTSNQKQQEENPSNNLLLSFFIHKSIGS